MLAALGAALVVTGAVRAQELAPPPTTTTLPSPAIAVPEIVERAEGATAELRAVERELARTVAVLELEATYPAERRRGDALRREAAAMLERELPAPVLDDLAAPWVPIRSGFAQWARTLTQDATAIESAVGRLDQARTVWEATRAEAEALDVPAEILRRIDTVLSQVAATRTRVGERRDLILVMQERVGSELERIDQLMAHIDAARRRSVGGLFERTGEPLLALTGEIEPWPQVWSRIRAAALFDLPKQRDLARDLGAGRGRWLALFLLLAVLLARLRRQARSWRAEDPTVAAATLPLETPYSVAFLLTLWLASDQWWAEARLVRSAVAVLATVSILRVIRPLLPETLRFSPWVLASAFVLDRARSFCFEVPALERWLLVAELAVAAVAIAIGTRRAFRDPTARPARWAAILRVLGPPALAIALVALATTVSGHLRFAQLAQIGLIQCFNLAALILVLVRVADALLVGLLRMRPLRLLHVVQRNRASLQAGLARAFAWGGFFAWTVAVTGRLGLLRPAREALEAAFAASYTRGAIAVSLGDVVAFAITVALAIAISRLLRTLLRDEVFPRMALQRGLPDTLSRLVHYAVVTVGFLVALASAGVSLDRIFVLAGALGIGIGFGLQQVVNNFVSGLILLFERPVRLGDTIELAGVAGSVHRIGMRSSTVRTWGGAEVIVPNADLVTQQVTNWTLSDMLRRIEIPVGVAYGSSPQQVLGILREKALAQQGVLADPAPMTLFLGFGESSLDFELRAWTDRFDDWAAIRSQLVLSIHDALAAAGITIPFPQRDLHLRSVEPEVAARLRRG